MIIDSFFVNKINQVLCLIRQKLQFLSANSFLVAKLDDLIFLFINLTIFITTFAQTEQIGLAASGVILLSIVKMFFTQGQLKLTIWNAFLLVYMLICFLSVLNSEMLFPSCIGYAKTLTFVGFYLSVGAYLKRNPRKILLLLLSVAAVCSIEAIIALIQSKVGVLEGAGWQDKTNLNPEEVISRVFGTLKPYNPNLLGGYLLVGLPSLIGLMGLFLIRKKFVLSAMFFVLVIVSTVALFLTGCRGAYMGLAMVLLTLFYFSYDLIFNEFKQKERLQRIWKRTLFIFSCVSAMILVSSPAILKRILSIFTLRQDSSTAFRMNVYQSSLQMFQDNWALGIGVGNKVFREIYGLYMRSGFDALSAYCIYLETAVESGIFALLAFIGFGLSLLIYAFKFVRGANSLSLKIVVISSVLAILGMALHGCVDTVFYRPQVQFIFWTMVAILSVCLTEKNFEVAKC